ncbi:hypothetical protein GQ53DRAFT_740248 [Thozetella sp. PMI_491]|nr:hypothetical protein GQ53DRAFT_740248 [Thozetella sp. PMI_491]
MRFSIGAVILAAAVSVAALPAQDAAATDLLTSSPLKWTGQIHLDQAPVTLEGTAQEIYEKIISINPNYDEELGLESSNATLAARDLGLEKRRAPTSSDFTCGYGNYVGALPIGLGIQYLYKIGNADCVAPAGKPGAGGCSRVSCSDNSGIWLCNDQSFETHIPCTLIADNAVEILIQCQYTNYAGGNTWNSFVRGQIFSTDRGWNTIINSAGGSC